MLPHAAPMLLVDRVIAFDPETISVEADISPDHPFARAEGVPAHVGLEMMAQACGAHVGALAKSGGLPVKLGFLLGTRRYESAIDWLAFGATLQIEARCVFAEDGMGVYDCRILQAGLQIAQAQLSLYQPDDAGAALMKLRGNDA